MNIQSIKFNTFPILKQSPLKTTPQSFKGAFKNEKELQNLSPMTPEYWQSFIFRCNGETFENSVTKKTDKKIEEYTKELTHKTKNYDTAYAIAIASINGTTGKIDPAAKNFADAILSSDTPPYKSDLHKIISEYKSTHWIPPVAPSNLPYLINSLKDCNGNFSKENLYFAQEVIKLQTSKKTYAYDLENVGILLNIAKDENGIVDQDTTQKVLKMYMSNNDIIKNNIQTLNGFPKEKRNDIFDFCIGLFEHADFGYINFNTIAGFCYDKKGNKIEDRAKFAQEIATLCPLATIDDETIEYCYNFEDFYEIFLRVKDVKNKIGTRKVIEKFLDKDGKIPTHTKSKMEEFINHACQLNDFDYIYNACQKEDGFDEETFKNTLTLIDSSNYSFYIPNKNCFEIANGSLNIDNLLLEDKIKYLNWLNKTISMIENNPEDDFETLHKYRDEISESIYPKEFSLPISKEAKTDVIQKVFKTNGKNEPLSDFETTMIEAFPTLKSHKKGLPLSTTREDFLQRIEQICKENPQAIEIIEKKTKVELITDGNHIVGYNNTISLDELDKNNELEKEIYDCCYNFLYENEVKTEDKKLNEYLNSIIKAFPEFINIIGKKQHDTHEYSLDIHSLLVLAESIKSPIYKELLEKEDKIALITTALFHDFAKRENEIDKNHPITSANASKGIIKKIFSDNSFANRIYDLIENHNFLEQVAHGDDVTKEILAFEYRRPRDFAIARTIAEADLKSVNDDFYDCYKDALTSRNITDIARNIYQIQATGNALNTSKIMYPNKTKANCTQNIKGRDFVVINLHEIDDNEDMGKYGFKQGLKKKDLRFLVHMSKNFSTLKMMDSNTIKGFISESFISPSKKSTYGMEDFGVILSHKNYDIINTCNQNQCSGNAKEVDRSIGFVFDNETRNNFKNGLLRYLRIDEDNLKPNDYTAFYIDVLSKGNINPKQKYQLGKYEFTGKQILRAMTLYQNTLLRDKLTHNEIIAYKPKIEAVVAKKRFPFAIEQEVLDFAYENKLPIIMI